MLSKDSVLDFQMQMKVRVMEPTKEMRQRTTFVPVPRARWRMTGVITSWFPYFHRSLVMSDLSRVLLHTHAEEQMRKQKLSVRLMTSSAVFAMSETCIRAQRPHRVVHNLLLVVARDGGSLSAAWLARRCFSGCCAPSGYTARWRRRRRSAP